MKSIYWILSLSLFSLWSLNLTAGDLYHCKQADGNMSFQDRPCAGETLKVEETKKGGPLSEEHLIKVLAKMTGKDESVLNDPKLRQGAEALVAIDAGKAYAFTKVYGVAEEYCGAEISNLLRNYKDKAYDVISLGQYYYSTGLYFQVGTKSVSHSGQELTAGLEQMLEQERNKYKYANKIKLDKLCKESAKALKAITMAYSS